MDSLGLPAALAPIAATATVTPTQTATRTTVPLAATTSTATRTSAPAATLTPTVSRTVPPASTATSTRAATTTRTPLPAATLTRTLTRAATASSTATLTRTLTTTSSPTLSRTATVTGTATITRTATVTGTATITGTQTITATATVTRTPTITATKSITLALQAETDIDEAKDGEFSVEKGALVVKFPAGAFAAAHRIRYSRAQADLAVLPTTLQQRVINRFTVRAFERANLTRETSQFKKPVTLTMRYDMTSIHGWDEKSLTLAYYDTKKKQWVPLPSVVDTKNKTVTAQTTHFTDFGLTSASDIQAYLPKWESAEPNLFLGAGSYGYPLELPPGRNGLVPKLGLSYSSSAVDMMGDTSQASFVGAGWSFSTNYIGRNTVSTYDSSDDLFTLVLNGAGYELVRDAADATVYHTWNKQYWRINFEQANDRWTIFTEDGTQYQFGYSAGSRGAQWRADIDPSHTRLETYTWHLEKVIDTHNNEIAYSYRHDVGSTECHGTALQYDEALYPEYIRYNKSGSNYLTEIALSYNTLQTVGDTQRKDYGYASIPVSQCSAPRQRSKLDQIDVKTTNGSMQLVRRYVFAYDYSTFTGVWHQPTNSLGRLTLKQITQYDMNGSLALPVTTFTYANNHLTQVNNGIGGTITLAYEDFYFATPYEIRGGYGWDFRGCALPNGLGCSSDWSPGTATEGMGTAGDISAMYVTATGIQYVGLNAKHIVPGANYRLHIEFAGGGAYRLTAFDGVSEVPIQGGLFKISPAASQLQVRVYVQDSTAALTVAWIDQLPTYSRVVSRTINDGQGGPSATYTYEYFGAALNDPPTITSIMGNPRMLVSTQLRGHSKVTVTDPTGAKVENYFAQDDIKAGRVLTVTQMDGSNNKYTRTQNTYANTPMSVAQIAPGDRSDFVYLSQTIKETFDGQPNAVSTKTTYAYDGYGNLRQQDEYDQNNALYRRTLRTYYPNTGTWMVNRLATEQVQNSISETSSKTSYYYDNSTYPHDLTRVLVNPSSTFTITQTTNAYDTYGNLKNTTDALGHTNIITYETTYNMFPAQTSNAAGHVTTNEYDYRFGKLKATTDPNGAKTSYTYDTFGRTSEIRNPLEHNSQGQPVYAATAKYAYTLGAPRSVVNVQVRNDLGGANSATYQQAWWFFDGMGRVIQQQSQGLNGQTIFANTVYTTTGQVWRTSNPYTLTVAGGTYQTPDWGKPSTVRVYDPIGRIKTTINPDTTSQTTTYSKWTTTFVDANGNQKKTVNDAFGRTIRVNEFNLGATYTTTYGYNVLNALTQVKDTENNITLMNYDWLGRKTWMKDPDLGEWSYGYDDVGNLTRQTDAKKQTTCFYYDPINRLKGKNYRADTNCPADPGTYTGASYTYDVGTNGIGRRTGMSVSGVDTTSWVYDKQGRVITQTNTITGAPATYATGWQYDAMNRVRTMVYPDGESVPTTYNTQGMPATLGTYITASDYSAASQLTSLTFGNNVVRTNYTYDSQNLRLTDLLTRAGTTDLQKSHYTYDSVGNVKQIQDNARGETTDYTYDNLDRLLTATLTGGASPYAQSWGYTPIGNLTSNTITTTFGITPTTYGYNPSNPTQRPHAVTHKDGVQKYQYDDNGNMWDHAGDGLTYDQENRLIQVTKQNGPLTTYAYNGDGVRVKRAVTENGLTKITYYVGNWWEVEVGSQPPQTPMPTATATRTPTITPTPTPTPSSTPTVVTTFSDTFDSGSSPAWTYSTYQTVPFNDGGENVLRTTGTGNNWNANFYRTSTLMSGQGVTVDFKVDAPDTYLHLAFDSSEGSNYYRWAVIAGGSKIYAQYISTNQQVYTQDLINPLQLNTWYRATLKVDDANGFLMEVHPRNSNSGGASFRMPMPTGKSWKFISWILQNSGYIDNYKEWKSAAFFTDAFNAASTSAWNYSGNQTVPFNDGGQNVLKTTGTGWNWASSFSRTSTLTSGQSTTLDFKVDSSDTVFHYALHSSEGGIYTRWAMVATGGKLVQQYVADGQNWSSPTDLINPLKLNTWYRATLTVDDTDGFVMEVHERDSGARGGSFHATMPAGRHWQPITWIYRDSAYIDNYQEWKYANTLSDTFDGIGSSKWTYSSYQSVPFNDGGQGVLKTVGAGNWNSVFYRNNILTHGDSVSVDFKLGAYNSGLHLALGSWDGGVHDRWAINTWGNTLDVQYIVNNQNFTPKTLVSNLKLNTWYCLTLKVDEVNGFWMEVHERDTGAGSNTYQTMMRAGRHWTFISWIYQETAYIDNYVELSQGTLVYAKNTYLVRADKPNARATEPVMELDGLTRLAAIDHTLTDATSSSTVNALQAPPTTTTKYYYFGAQRVAMKTSAVAGVTYLHGDHLGSTSVTSGAQPSSQTYYPYGKVRSGTLPTDYTFTGQHADSDGLMYYGARYYDAALGRFVSADTIVPNQFNPQSLNRYAYVLNNPVRYTDPTGHDCGENDYGSYRTCGGDDENKGLSTTSPILDLPDFNYTSDQGWRDIWKWFEAHPGYNPYLDPLVTGPGGWFSEGAFANPVVINEWALWMSNNGNARGIERAMRDAARVWYEIAPPGSDLAKFSKDISENDLRFMINQLAMETSSAAGISIAGMVFGGITHGNSNSSPKPTWLYKLVDKQTGKVMKYGVTSADNPLC